MVLYLELFRDFVMITFAAGPPLPAMPASHPSRVASQTALEAVQTITGTGKVRWGVPLGLPEAETAACGGEEAPKKR